MISISIIEVSTKLPKDFHRYFSEFPLDFQWMTKVYHCNFHWKLIQILTGFQMDFYRHFVEISIEYQLDFQ